jgi:hypothetical protein
MADKLKVFKNANVTQEDSNSALSIPVTNTGDDTRAVLKDVQLEMTGLTSEDAGFYKYPTTLQVDGVKQGPSVNLGGNNVASTPMLLSGSQIVGENSSVTLEVEAEALLSDYGLVQVIYLGRTESKPRIATLSMNATSPESTGATTLLQNTIDNSILTDGPTTGYSGCCFTSNEIKKYAYTTGGELIILGEDGAQLVSHNWGTTCYAMGVDDTYCYGKSSNSESKLRRFNHVTMTAASDLTTTGGAPYGNSNKGWVDVYDGYFYYRPDGSPQTTYRVDLETGAFSTKNFGSLNQSEFLGGVINTNIHGKTFVVMHGDQTIGVVNYETGEYSNDASIFPTNPTTTGNNAVISLAPGIIWVNNGSYNTSLIINTNGIDHDSAPNQYTQTLTTGIISIGGTSNVFVGGKHQAIKNKSRKLNHRILASGVEAT